MNAQDGLLHQMYKKGGVGIETVVDFVKEVSNMVLTKDAIFIMDNARIHSVECMKAVLPENHSVKLIPPYSPQLNPVEELISCWN